MDPTEPYFRWDWVARHLDGPNGVWVRLSNHVLLTVITVTIGFALALALSLFIVRNRWSYAPITAVAGVLYTIPSLALFAVLVPVTGLGLLTAEIGLVSYTLLILVRNIVAGLDGVPDEVREAAAGMGYTRTQMLLRVELPIAVPTIVAGLRVATVTTIGLVIVTALIGISNLGQFILRDGVNRAFNTPLVLGGALSILLAVVADLALVGLQWLAAPWARKAVVRRG